MATPQNPNKCRTQPKGQRDVRGGSRNWLAQIIAELQRALQGGSGPFRGP